MPERILLVLKIWLAQWRHPRYMLAGVLHIVLFFGFLILAARSTQLVVLGFVDGFVIPVSAARSARSTTSSRTSPPRQSSWPWSILAVRRAVFKPARYAVPEKLGKDHTPEALFVLGLIATLLISESLFEGSLLAAQGEGRAAVSLLTLTWAFQRAAGRPAVSSLSPASTWPPTPSTISRSSSSSASSRSASTSTSSRRSSTSSSCGCRPATSSRCVHGVSDAQLDELQVLRGQEVRGLHLEAHAGLLQLRRLRPLLGPLPRQRRQTAPLPRFISIKARDYAFEHYPLFGKIKTASPIPLIGRIYSEDEIWSCTTCGACEEECPVGIEYIDKMVDLRRGMVDEGMVPQSLQKPMSALEKRGNPWGKLEKKRAEWTAGVGEACR